MIPVEIKEELKIAGRCFGLILIGYVVLNAALDITVSCQGMRGYYGSDAFFAAAVPMGSSPAGLRATPFPDIGSNGVVGVYLISDRKSDLVWRTVTIRLMHESGLILAETTTSPFNAMDVFDEGNWHCLMVEVKMWEMGQVFPVDWSRGMCWMNVESRGADGTDAAVMFPVWME